MADSNNITGNYGSNLLLGTNEDETIDGAGGIDVIDGNDSIKGGDASIFDLWYGNSDFLMGGSGDDTIEGGGGDLLLGGSGNDSLDGGTGNDLVRGGSGNDTVLGGEGNDRVLGDSGDDSVDGGAGDDLVLGGAGNDTLTGGIGNDTLYGGTGDDSVDGGTGDDVLYAGTGNDTLTGGEGDDTFVILEGTGGTTITDFNVSDDKIFVGALTTVPTLEQLLGKMTDIDTDNDTTADSVTIDLTDFGGGMVTLEGVTKSDLMDGAALNADLFDYGHDSLVGTTDAEYITGGVGNDTMAGGGGADDFISRDDHGNDTITDFSAADDKIDLSRLSTAITAEQLLGKLTDLADSDNDGTADGVTINLTDFGGGTITLQGVTKADLMTGEALNTTLFMLPDGTAGTDDGTWSGTDDPDGVSGGEADLNFQAKAGGDAVWAGEGNDTVDGRRLGSPAAG